MMCPALMVALIKTSEASTSVIAQAPVRPVDYFSHQSSSYDANYIVNSI